MGGLSGGNNHKAIRNKVDWWRSIVEPSKRTGFLWPRGNHARPWVFMYVYLGHLISILRWIIGTVWMQVLPTRWMSCCYHCYHYWLHSLEHISWKGFFFGLQGFLGWVYETVTAQSSSVNERPQRWVACDKSAVLFCIDFATALVFDVGKVG